MTNLRLAILAAILALLTPLKALDLTLPDGTKYTNIQLKEKTDLGIFITHTSGQTFVDYLVLAPADQFTFGYNEAKYQLVKTQLSAAPATAQKSIFSDEEEPASRESAKAPVSSLTATTSSKSSRLRTAAASSTPSVPAHQCAATTKKGARCSRDAEPGSAYCWQHGR